MNARSQVEVAELDPVRGGRWADRDLFALDADVTVYWPDVRPCYEEAHPARPQPICSCGFDRRKPARMQRLPQRNAALAGVGVQQSISENA